MLSRPPDRSASPSRISRATHGARPPDPGPRPPGTELSMKQSVLVIDDSLTIREELRVAFESAGYEVATAASGEEGLRVAAERRPHAVVVDGQLPGIDGATVVHRIRWDSALKRTPCLF